MGSHDPNSWRRYQQIHDAEMARLRASGFIHQDNLTWCAVSGGFRLYGYLACPGNITIKVAKTLVVVDHDKEELFVRTVSYAYNAAVHGFNTFLRYDNAHPIAGSSDRHHRHSVNWRTGAEGPGSPHWVGEDGWPTLGTFIREVRNWYWDNWTDLEREFDPATLAPLLDVHDYEKGIEDESR